MFGAILPNPAVSYHTVSKLASAFTHKSLAKPYTFCWIFVTLVPPRLIPRGRARAAGAERQPRQAVPTRDVREGGAPLPRRQHSHVQLNDRQQNDAPPVPGAHPRYPPLRGVGMGL